MGQSVINGSRTITNGLTVSGGAVDFGSAASQKMKTGTVSAIPGTCTVGQVYFASDATAGQNLYFCTATNTWTQQVAGGGSSYTLELVEHFGTGVASTGVGQWAWKSANAPGSTNTNFSPFLDSDAKRIGTVSLGTNNVQNQGGMASPSTDAYGGQAHMPGKIFGQTDIPWNVTYDFKISHSTAITFFIGLETNAASSTLYKNIGSTDWVGVCVDNGDSDFSFCLSRGTAKTSLGVAVDTNWHRMVIRSDGTTTNKYWIKFDAGTELSVCSAGCDITSSVSTYAGFGYLPRVDIQTNAVGDWRSISMDFWRFRIATSLTY